MRTLTEKEKATIGAAVLFAGLAICVGMFIRGKKPAPTATPKVPVAVSSTNTTVVTNPPSVVVATTVVSPATNIVTQTNVVTVTNVVSQTNLVQIKLIETNTVTLVVTNTVRVPLSPAPVPDRVAPVVMVVTSTPPAVVIHNNNNNTIYNGPSPVVGTNNVETNKVAIPMSSPTADWVPVSLAPVVASEAPVSVVYESQPPTVAGETVIVAPTPAVVIEKPYWGFEYYSGYSGRVGVHSYTTKAVSYSVAARNGRSREHCPDRVVRSAPNYSRSFASYPHAPVRTGARVYVR